MKELIGKRTHNSRTYDLGGGKRRIVIDPTLTVQPSAKDTYISENEPDTNFGGLDYVQTYDRTARARRPILEFDISELPAEATLTSASLQLYYYVYYQSPEGRTVWAYKLTRTDWVELEATWNDYKTDTPWTSAGGDYVTSNPAGGSTVFPHDYGWMSWDVLAIVQDAYNSSNPAEFLVKNETEGLADYAQARFYSREYTGDTSLCPKLVIDYTVTYEKIFTETINLTDSLVKMPYKTLLDTAAVVDTIKKSSTKSLVDNIAISDSIVTAKKFFRVFTDNVAVTDSITLAKKFFRVFSEAITIIDSITKVRTKVKIFTEVITVADSITTAKKFFRVFTDNIEVTDQLIRAKKFFRIFTESILVTDTIAKKFSRVFTESITIADSIGRRITKVLTELITISEIFTKLRVILKIRELLAVRLRGAVRVLNSIRNIGR